MVAEPEKKQEVNHKGLEVKPRLTFRFAPSQLRRDAVSALKGEKSPTKDLVLQLLSSDDKFEVRTGLHIYEGMEDSFDEVFPKLVKLRQHSDSKIREVTISALGKHGNEAIPYLEEVNEKKLQEYGPAMEQLILIIGNPEDEGRAERKRRKESKRADKELAASWSENTDWDFADQASTDFLWHQKPWQATPHKDDLQDKLSRIDKISEQLNQEFGDRFIGISVFGSASKGYLKPESDLELMLLPSHNQEISSRFSSLAFADNNLYVDLLVKDRRQLDRAAYFGGLFFGDHKNLALKQKAIIENMTNEEWEHLRDREFKEESLSGKQIARFGIADKEKRDALNHAISLLRIPPTRNKVLEILEKRVNPSNS